MNTRLLNKLPKVIIITGPTGVGKSSIAKILTSKLDGELITGDSV